MFEFIEDGFLVTRLKEEFRKAQEHSEKLESPEIGVSHNGIKFLEWLEARGIYYQLREEKTTTE